MVNLPQHIKQFVLTHFETITQIEVICFLYKNQNIQFSTSSLASLLYLSNNLVTLVMKKFTRLGLVVEDGNYFQFNDNCTDQNLKCLDFIVTTFPDSQKQYISLLFDNFMD